MATTAPARPYSTGSAIPGTTSGVEAVTGRVAGTVLADCTAGPVATVPKP
ncbi:MAG: hypothetical protein ACRYGM_05855 [Janthinobacterium lividum]